MAFAPCSMLSELKNFDESIETYGSEIEKWAEGLSSRWSELTQRARERTYWASSCLRNYEWGRIQVLSG